MNGDEPEIINILTVDSRGSFRRGDNYPRLIYLSTVLRWAVKGTFLQEQVNDAAQIIRNNDSALASVQGLLADGIESGSVAVFNTHSKLPIGRTEKESLVTRLRTMDVKNNLSGLSGINDLDYSLDGKKLYHFITANAAPTDDDFQKGGVWHNLMWDAPNEWHTHHEQAETPTDTAAKGEAVRGITKGEVMAAFQGLKWDYDHWGRNLASPPNWLIECRVAKGSKRKQASALWNPVLIAVALLDKQIPIKKLDAVFVGLKDWIDEWQEASALFRD